MKYSFTFGICFLSLFNLHTVNAQQKVDTIYYLLDTAKIPIKDRVFSIEKEGPAMFYSIDCKCFPYGSAISFFYDIANKKEKTISLEEFGKIKTVSITKLIDLALKCLPPGHTSMYKFIFAEPNGNNIRLTETLLWIPSKNQNSTTDDVIKPLRF